MANDKSKKIGDVKLDVDQVKQMKKNNSLEENFERVKKAIENNELYDVVQDQISNQAVWNSEDKDENTLLYYALENNNASWVEWIIQHKDFDSDAIKGKKIEQFLSCTNDDRTQKTLLRCAFFRLMKDRKFQQQRGSMSKQGDMTRYIDKGFDVNAKDDKGYTALMCAVANHEKEIYKLLKKNKAKFEATDIHGETVMDYVESNNTFAKNVQSDFYKRVDANSMLIWDKIDGIKGYEGKFVEYVKQQISNFSTYNSKEKAKIDKLFEADNIKLLSSAEIQILSQHAQTQKQPLLSERILKAAEFARDLKNREFELKNTSKTLKKAFRRVKKAITNGESYLEVKDAVIDEAAVWNHKDIDKNILLDYAVKHGSVHWVEWIIQHEDFDSNAIKGKNIENFLSDAHDHQTKETLLRCAFFRLMKEGKFKRQDMELYLREGFDVNGTDDEANYTPLMCAVDNDKKEIYELLKNEEPDFLFIACEDGKTVMDYVSDKSEWQAKVKSDCYQEVEEEHMYDYLELLDHNSVKLIDSLEDVASGKYTRCNILTLCSKFLNEDNTQLINKLENVKDLFQEVSDEKILKFYDKYLSSNSIREAQEQFGMILLSQVVLHDKTDLLRKLMKKKNFKDNEKFIEKLNNESLNFKEKLPVFYVENMQDNEQKYQCIKAKIKNFNNYDSQEQNNIKNLFTDNNMQLFAERRRRKLYKSALNRNDALAQLINSKWQVVESRKNKEVKQKSRVYKDIDISKSTGMKLENDHASKTERDDKELKEQFNVIKQAIKNDQLYDVVKDQISEKGLWNHRRKHNKLLLNYALENNNASWVEWIIQHEDFDSNAIKGKNIEQFLSCTNDNRTKETLLRCAFFRLIKEGNFEVKDMEFYEAKDLFLNVSDAKILEFYDKYLSSDNLTGLELNFKQQLNTILLSQVILHEKIDLLHKLMDRKNLKITEDIITKLNTHGYDTSKLPVIFVAKIKSCPGYEGKFVEYVKQKISNFNNYNYEEKTNIKMLFKAENIKLFSEKEREDLYKYALSKSELLSKLISTEWKISQVSKYHPKQQETKSDYISQFDGVKPKNEQESRTGGVKSEPFKKHFNETEQAIKKNDSSVAKQGQISQGDLSSEKETLYQIITQVLRENPKKDLEGGMTTISRIVKLFKIIMNVLVNRGALSTLKQKRSNDSNVRRVSSRDNATSSFSSDEANIFDNLSLTSNKQKQTNLNNRTRSGSISNNRPTKKTRFI